MKVLKKISYYWRCIKWIYNHRDEYDCRQKWKRMSKEVQE